MGNAPAIKDLNDKAFMNLRNQGTYLIEGSLYSCAVLNHMQQTYSLLGWSSTVLIPACDSSSPAFHMMYAA